MTTRTRVAALAGALLLALPGAAQAAEPSEGAIDIYDTPEVSWTGNAGGSAINLAHFFLDQQVVDDCVQPFCDVFTLTVGPDAKKLEVGAENTYGYVEMQIRDEAGNEVFYSVGEADVPTVYKKSKPKPGVYTVEIITSAIAPSVDDDAYFAYANVNDGVKTPRPEAQG
jgi:hypothetical protein